MLPSTHPLRILMYPHQHLTLATNLYEVPLLISKDQFAPSVWSFDFDSLKGFIATKTKEFQISSLDFWADAGKRGFDKKGKPLHVAAGQSPKDFSYPYLQTRGSLFNIIQEYVEGYIDAHYSDEKAVGTDQYLQNWYEELHKYTPGGIKSYAGNKPTKVGLTKLISLFINEVSTKHHDISHAISNYTPWLQYIPRQVKTNNVLDPIGNHQGYTNTALIATLPASVTFANDFTADDQPFSKILSVTQKKHMKSFHKKMGVYQNKLEEQLKGTPQADQLDVIFPKDVAPAVDA